MRNLKKWIAKKLRQKLISRNKEIMGVWIDNPWRDVKEVSELEQLLKDKSCAEFAKERYQENIKYAHDENEMKMKVMKF